MTAAIVKEEMDDHSSELYSGNSPTSFAIRCCKCQKSFANIKDVRSHLSWHIRYAPYCCAYCDATLFSEEKLRLHSRSSEECKDKPLKIIHDPDEENESLLSNLVSQSLQQSNIFEASVVGSPSPSRSSAGTSGIPNTSQISVNRSAVPSSISPAGSSSAQLEQRRSLSSDQQSQPPEHILDTSGAFYHHQGLGIGTVPTSTSSRSFGDFSLSTGNGLMWQGSPDDLGRIRNSDTGYDLRTSRPFPVYSGLDQQDKESSSPDIVESYNQSGSSFAPGGNSNLLSAMPSGNERRVEDFDTFGRKCLAGRHRKPRTTFSTNTLKVLNDYFKKNRHPIGSELSALAESLGHKREVIRIWFCNKRQAQKYTINRLKYASPDRRAAIVARLATRNPEVLTSISGISAQDAKPPPNASEFGEIASHGNSTGDVCQVGASQNEDEISIIEESSEKKEY